MQIVNPYDDDSGFDEIRAKWGRPKIIEPRNGLWRYICAICEAGWDGPIGDYCEWCHGRWLAGRDRLLHPEWWNWIETYWRLSEINQEVWRKTRGLRHDFEEQWARDLHAAVLSGLITDHERADALRRR